MCVKYYRTFFIYRKLLLKPQKQYMEMIQSLREQLPVLSNLYQQYIWLPGWITGLVWVEPSRPSLKDEIVCWFFFLPLTTAGFLNRKASRNWHDIWLHTAVASTPGHLSTSVSFQETYASIVQKCVLASQLRNSQTDQITFWTLPEELGLDYWKHNGWIGENFCHHKKTTKIADIIIN